MKFSLIRNNSIDSVNEISAEEKDELIGYFLAVKATKYAVNPNRNEEITFVASHENVSLGHSPQPPKGFMLYVSDISYMPLAYDGIEEETEKSEQWFYNLPNDHQQLW